MQKYVEKINFRQVETCTEFLQHIKIKFGKKGKPQTTLLLPKYLIMENQKNMSLSRKRKYIEK